ncbi:replication protein A 32 kDa subunit A [Lathyrus oleraceus]|uniref:replication protein A 32 kDa subunit A n=1 Tax=Pisum sativum TaxID=3888 RepID=UPI0021CF75EB|nr:replication protein A 32 kDa subunit A-like [Pisum sativum]
MFSSSQFDSSNAFSGGGFTSSQLNESSPAPTKSRDSQGLVPVTVKQISEASQSGDEKSNFAINGVDLTNVRGYIYFWDEPMILWGLHFDEIPFPFIDCIHSHLLAKVKLEGTPSTYPPTNSSINTPVKSALNGSQAPSNPGYTQYSTDGLKDCDKLVIDYLQQHSSMLDERGIHVEELARELKLPLDRIKLSVKALEDDGLVYSTIDDSHYKQA